MKYRRFSILMALLVLGLGCRKHGYDLDDPDSCNSPFTAIPCTSLEGAGQFGSPGMPGGSTTVQPRRQMQ